MRRRRRVGWGVGALVAVMAAPAGAATLTTREEVVCAPGALECGSWHTMTYAAGSERNRVVIAGAKAFAVVVYDPGVPMTAGPFRVPGLANPVVGDPLNLDVVPLEETWGCTSPTGKSAGMCLATPGRDCPPYISCSTDTPAFAVVRVDLGDANDSLRLEPAGPPVTVHMGFGNDEVDSHNGVVDQIDCGDGIDHVAAEYRDVVSSNCEAVTRGPGL
jgi:hypothetical protein